MFFCIVMKNQFHPDYVSCFIRPANGMSVSPNRIQYGARLCKNELVDALANTWYTSCKRGCNLYIPHTSIEFYYLSDIRFSRLFFHSNTPLPHVARWCFVSLLSVLAGCRNDWTPRRNIMLRPPFSYCGSYLRFWSISSSQFKI